MFNFSVRMAHALSLAMAHTVCLALATVRGRNRLSEEESLKTLAAKISREKPVMFLKTYDFKSFGCIFT